MLRSYRRFGADIAGVSPQARALAGVACGYACGASPRLLRVLKRMGANGEANGKRIFLLIKKILRFCSEMTSEESVNLVFMR